MRFNVFSSKLLCGWSILMAVWVASSTLRGPQLRAQTKFPSRQQQDLAVTTVTITDKVLVRDCVPFGINLSYGNDSYWASPWVKDRIRANFEGTTYRQCLTGYVRDATGMSVWVDTPEHWKQIHVGAKFTILNGPGKGTSGTIKDITTKRFEHQGKLKDFTYYVFDRKIPPAPKEIGLPGIMVERFSLDEGFVGRPDEFRRSNAGMKDKTPRVDVAIGDVPPGSAGRAACHLIAPDPSQNAFIRFTTFDKHVGENNGTWNLSFWAKATAGKPTLEVVVSANRDPVPPPQTVELTNEWNEYDLAFEVRGISEPDWRNPRDQRGLFFAWHVCGGEVLLDEVSGQMAEEQNPTVFRDDLLATLRRLGVGNVRHIQQGGSTLDNILTPGRYAHCFTSVRIHKPGPFAEKSSHAFSLHEMYELCEHIGCDPWYCLPGTLHEEAMTRFMEYLGAPPDVGYGKLRAELGHPKPWTDVFRSIHVEFGNEAWNSAAPYHSGGFSGPDYWTGLIAMAKRSPYYRNNVLFHPAGQAAFANRNVEIMKNTPNGDRFAIGPYMLTHVTSQDVNLHPSDDDFFRWVLAWPIFRSRDPRGYMYQNHQNAKKAGCELSVYEFNHHTLAHEGVPEEVRKNIFTSQGGAINVINTMLLMLKEHGIRIHSAFPLASGSDGGIWDFVLSMRKGHERYRPTFLAMSVANKVVHGDLLETVHQDADHRWSAEGVFYTEWKKEPKSIKYDNIPCLMSYAFRNGAQRGVILVNLDVEHNVPVRLQFTGGSQQDQALSYSLTADKITANNEWENGGPQVQIVEQTILDFTSGHRVLIPPFSMQAFVWEAE